MCNEGSGVDRFVERVRAALGDLPFELVVVDDGSTDATLERLRVAALEDRRVRVIALARNFGHQTALTAGLDAARGDVAVTIDGDLQDPPELIPELLERWRRGADVVSAVRSERSGESRFKLATARWFYRVFRRLANVDLPAQSGDFRLMDRCALDALGSMRERNRFLRGMTVWVGFRQDSVTYDRDARTDGRSKYSLRRMVRFSFDALTSFSQVPLQLAMLLGFALSLAAFLGLPLVIVARYLGIFTKGVPTVLFAVLLIGGIQLITVGIIGEYVGRIYDEVKKRPLYIVRERCNFEPSEPELLDVAGEHERAVGSP
jgi:dolichol-phosphate mannosyltransferase